MRFLVIHPGASTSTHDVYTGLVTGLEANGHSVVHYALDARIGISDGFLKHSWSVAVKEQPALPPPNKADVIYHASTGVFEKVLRHQPDYVLIVSGMYFHPDALVFLKRMRVPVGVLLTESPYDAEKERRVTSIVDVAWTNERSAVEKLRELNPRVKYLPHAYNPVVHHPKIGSDDLPDVRSHDVVFVGSWFEEREQVLGAVDWKGIDFGLYGAWGDLPPRMRLRKSLMGKEIPNGTAAALYRRAKIGLNLHRQSAGFGRNTPKMRHCQSLNPRSYELAACGAFHISDFRPELSEIFGDAVPSFKSPGELQDSIAVWLAASPEARFEKALQARDAVRPHTWVARAAQVVDDLLALPKEV